ncbi:tetratricopeptide repeat protein [bacterium]|nr:tetratricopeptide repeat protein [bacterium]
MNRNFIPIKSLLFVCAMMAAPVQAQHFLFPDSLLDQLRSGNENIAKIRETYLDQLRLHPESERLHFCVAETYVMQSRFPEARHHYHEVLRMNPDNTQAGFRLAVTYEQEAKLDSALMIAEPLAIKHPGDSRLLFKTGNLFEQASDYHQAMVYYKQWEKADTQSPWPATCVGQIFEKTGNPDSARAAYLRAEENGGTAQSAYRLFLHARRHADPDLSRLYQESTFERTISEISLSEKLWQPSLENPFDPQTTQTTPIKNADELIKILRSVVANWFPSPASESLETRILDQMKKHPDAPLLLEQLAFVYKQQKNWDQAIHVYERFLSLQPRSPEGLKNLGSIYEQQKEWSKAFQIYQKGLNLDLESEEFYPLVVRTATRAGCLQSLNERWFRLLQAHPDNALLRHYLIHLHSQSGQNDDAKK